MQDPMTAPMVPAFKPSLLAQALLAAMLATPIVAFAQNAPTDLGSVQAGASGASRMTAAQHEKAKQESAPHQAITQGSLAAKQPQSIISQHVIQNTDGSAANYTDIISIAPSVVSVDPNGPGLMESQGGPTIRGFQDGQYNVTFDGIPWGDSNDFTHHSTSYFMPQDIGQVVVDRGPGDASNLGPATFGGSVKVRSKDPLDVPTTTLYGTFGSFNTKLLGAEFDTGVMKNYGDLRAFFDYRQLKSDGYLTGTGLRRQNLFFKAQKPVGDSSLLTLVAMKNDLTQHFSLGATSFPYVDPNNGTSGLPGQIQVFGPNYGMNNNPLSQAYSGYNYDSISTDFEYLGLKTSLGAVQLDNKVYTYGYYHDGYNGLDPNGGNYAYGTLNGPAGSPGDGTFPAGAATTNGTVYGANNVPGQKMQMNYRSWGDILRMSQQLGQGTLKYGLWADHQTNDRYQYEIDWTNGGAYNAATTLAATDRLMYDTLVQAQPYVEYAWTVTPSLTVTPGLKYAYFRRTIDAPVNQKTNSPLNYAQSWGKALPAVDVHYAIAPNWSAYFQAAKGFLAPNLNVFFVTNPTISDQGLAPEETTNYQVGTTWKSQRLTLSGDLYSIDFSNQVNKKTIAGNTIFYNQGGTKYKGVEGEATYYVGSGVSVYGNASYNSAKVDSSGLQVAGVPKTTGALGLIYNRGAWYASAVTKFVGSRSGDVTGSSPGSTELYPLKSYSVTNLALNYTVQGSEVVPHGTKIGVQVFNVFDNNDLYALAGYTANNVPLFWTVPGRSLMLNFSVPFQ
ncbi:MAG: TonB-dependent receptor [Proteobacteria bacterium]|nr:TonB-dependent receptor [Pseudomonadota bacterium]